MPFANRWLGMALVCVGSVACAGSNKPVRSVAEYDLACRSGVEVTKIDDQHYAASGCGRGAVYVQACDDTGCRWSRMRHGHESEVAGVQAPPVYAPSAEREIIAAPPPPAREVVPAPPPQEREVIPAPPPASSGGEAPPADQGAAPAPSSSLDNQLSEPYQAEVPAQPVAQRVQYAPPAPLVESPPPAPQPSYAWVGGYWWWGSWGWTWVPGYWCPPRPGFVFITGGWYLTNGWWWYYPGGWGYPGTRVIVHAPAPRRERVVTVRTVRTTPAAHVSTHRVDTRPVSPRREVLPAPAPSRSITNTQRNFQQPRPFAPSASPLQSYPSRSVSATRAAPSARPSSVGRLVLPRQSVPSRNVYSGSSGVSRDAFVGPKSSSSVGARGSVRPSTGKAPSRTPSRTIQSTRPPSRSFSRPPSSARPPVQRVSPRHRLATRFQRWRGAAERPAFSGSRRSGGKR